MRPSDPGFDANGFAETPCERSAPIATGGRGLAALSETGLASRFFAWGGLSGRTYVFSVYPASACPAFCDAVLLVAARDERGRRRILAGLDTGAFPEPLLARAERSFAHCAGTLEFHVHLLARSASERRAALADLSAGPGMTSSFAPEDF